MCVCFCLKFEFLCFYWFWELNNVIFLFHYTGVSPHGRGSNSRVPHHEKVGIFFIQEDSYKVRPSFFLWVLCLYVFVLFFCHPRWIYEIQTFASAERPDKPQSVLQLDMVYVIGDPSQITTCQLSWT